MFPVKTRAYPSESTNTASGLLKTDLGEDLSHPFGRTPTDSIWREQDQTQGYKG